MKKHWDTLLEHSTAAATIFAFAIVSFILFVIAAIAIGIAKILLLFK